MGEMPLLLHIFLLVTVSPTLSLEQPRTGTSAAVRRSLAGEEEAVANATTNSGGEAPTTTRAVVTPGLPLHNVTLRLFSIGINTMEKNSDKIDSVSSTWGKRARPMFVLPGGPACPRVRSALEYGLERRAPVLVYDELIPCKEYPPVVGWARTLYHMAQAPAKWYIKCDDDSFVHVKRLRALLVFLEHSVQLDPLQVPLYFGREGTGRVNEQHLIGLENKSYVLGGPCVFMSRMALLKVLPILDECMFEEMMRVHSDSMLGRCFMKLGIEAGIPNRPARLEKHFFLNFYGPKPLDGTTVEPFAASTVPRNMSFFNRYLPVTMHSIKDADLMLFMHMKLHIQSMHHEEAALVKQLVEVWV